MRLLTFHHLDLISLLLTQNGHLDDLQLPLLPPWIKAIDVQDDTTVKRDHSSSHNKLSSSPTSSNTSRLSTSPASKRRNGSFLFNLQYKVRSTMRAVSDGGKSNPNSPESRSQSLLIPTVLKEPESPTTLKSQSVPLIAGHGKFDFEMDVDGTREDKNPTYGGMDLSVATESKTGSSESRSGVADAGPSHCLIESPNDCTSNHSDRVEPKGLVNIDSLDTNQIEQLQVYLNGLAQQPSVLVSLPWQEFFCTSNALGSHTPKTQSQCHTSDAKAANNHDTLTSRDKETMALLRLSSAQRKKMMRRSRSLGEGFLAVFEAGKDAGKQSHKAVDKSDKEEEAEVLVTPDGQDQDQITNGQNVKSIENLSKEEQGKDDAMNATGTDQIQSTVTSTNAHSMNTLDSVSASAIAGVDVRNQDEGSSPPRATSKIKPEDPTSISPTAPQTPKSSTKKSVTVEDFELIRVLGKGCAGKASRIPV